MRRALVPALAGIALLAPARAAALPATWSVVDHGSRGGLTYAGPPVAGVGAVYLPAGTRPGRRLRVAYLLAGTGRAAGLARALGVAGAGDQLAWQRTTPPFAVVVTSADGGRALAGAMHYAEQTLDVSGQGARRAVIGFGGLAPAALRAVLQPALHIGTGIAVGGRIPRRLAQGIQSAVRARRARVYRAALPPGVKTLPLWRHHLLEALTYAFASQDANHASRSAEAIAPYGWTRIAVGPHGGTVWQGVIPNRGQPGHPRASLVYLPPAVQRNLHYPALYLLHGLRGSPYSFVGGLRLAAVADNLIHAHRVRPFIAVMPPAGTSAEFDGEWTGPWEDYVVQDVVPWADRHLPLTTAQTGRTLAGFSAGAYGSIDIALRHPGLFGTLESWSGYFKSPRDGSLANATQAENLAHDPQALVRAQARELKARNVRIFLSAGRNERKTLAATRAFAWELSDLGVDHVLHLTAGGHHGRTWRAVLPAGLLYAFAR